MADPPLLDLRSTTQILRHSILTLRSSLLPLLLASLLLFSFRSVLLFGTLRLSSAVDADPAVRSLLSRLSSPPPPTPTVRSRRPPFLHLSRVGTLDDDDSFFSDSPPSDPFSAVSPNSSFPLPSLLFLSDVGFKLGLGFPRNPRPRPRASPPILFSLPIDDDDADGDEDQARGDQDSTFDLTREDAFVILYLLSVLSSTHALAVLGFLLTYAAVLGVVFYSVASSLLDRPLVLPRVLHSGVRLGFRKLIGFVFLWWAARDAVVQFLCIYFFSEIRDQNRLFKLFIKVKLMPLSFTAPSQLVSWAGIADGDLSAMSGFLLMWSLVEAAVSFNLMVVPWVLIMDRNVGRRGPDVVKEGCHLVSLMTSQAFYIKILEMLVCGNLSRRVLMVIGGGAFAGVLQSVAEVFFMVVWLVYYFVLRCKDGELEGRRFGRADLEDCIDGIS